VTPDGSASPSHGERLHRDVPSSYDAAYYRDNGQSGDRPALRWYARLARRYGGPGPYLDFGCGTGHLLRRLAALGPAAGFEVSPWAAAAARSTAGCPVHERLDELPAGAFTMVVAVHVVEHLDDAVLTAALATWRRVLRPGGRALVVTPDLGGRGHTLSGAGWVGFADATHVNLKPRARWRELLEAQGFAVLHEGGDGLWNVPYGGRPYPADVVRAAPAFVQYLAGRLLLPPGSGESAIFVVGRA
jgi:SAM-dependent methyltransferase